jgi:hypothetical protein
MKNALREFSAAGEAGYKECIKNPLLSTQYNF